MEKNNKIQFLDFRSKEAFVNEHLCGSVFIGQQDFSSEWLMNVTLDLSSPIRIVVQDDVNQDTRLTHLSLDKSIQFIEGDLETWKNAGHLTRSLNNIDQMDYASDFNADCMISLDVRSEMEFHKEHIIGVRSFPLNKIFENLRRIDPDTTYYLHSNDGHRAAIAASILNAEGFKTVLIKGEYMIMRTLGFSLKGRETSLQAS